MAAQLYVVATPIGNLGDMTPRALEVLRQVDLIAAEDTRHSGRLLHHFGIQTAVTSYHDHSLDTDLERLMRHLEKGQTLALISDAGTPLISDPGYQLIVACHEAKIPVVPIPGVSAVIAALSVAGLPTNRFHFEGFLPAKAGQKTSRLEQIRSVPDTLVFFESPRRLLDTLELLERVLGDRQAALCRELTKTFETVRRDNLSALRNWVEADPQQQMGEIVLVVRGDEPKPGALTADHLSLLRRLARELPPRRAASVVADITGISARTLYQALIDEGR